MTATVNYHPTQIFQKAIYGNSLPQITVSLMGCVNSIAQITVIMMSLTLLLIEISSLIRLRRPLALRYLVIKSPIVTSGISIRAEGCTSRQS